MKLQIEKAVYGGAGLAHQTEGADTGQSSLCALHPARRSRRSSHTRAEEYIRRSLSDPDFERLQRSHPARLRPLRKMRRMPLPARRIFRATPDEIYHPAGDPRTSWTDSTSCNHDAYRRALGIPEPHSFPSRRIKRDDTNWLQPPRIERFPGHPRMPHLRSAVGSRRSGTSAYRRSRSSAARWLRSATEVEFFTTGDERSIADDSLRLQATIRIHHTVRKTPASGTGTDRRRSSSAG